MKQYLGTIVTVPLLSKWQQCVLDVRIPMVARIFIKDMNARLQWQARDVKVRQ